LSRPAWETLQCSGAKPQRPLWASTGTKDTHYSDVLYVSELVGPEVVNTMPEQTLWVFADHGQVARTVDGHSARAEESSPPLGGPASMSTASPRNSSARAFCDSYHQLLNCIESKLTALAPATS
jgi:transaldolase